MLELTAPFFRESNHDNEVVISLSRISRSIGDYMEVVRPPLLPHDSEHRTWAPQKHDTGKHTGKFSFIRRSAPWHDPTYIHKSVTLDGLNVDNGLVERKSQHVSSTRMRTAKKSPTPSCSAVHGDLNTGFTLASICVGNRWYGALESESKMAVESSFRDSGSDRM